MLKFQCLINGKYVQKFGARLKKSAGKYISYLTGQAKGRKHERNKKNCSEFAVILGEGCSLKHWFKEFLIDLLGQPCPIIGSLYFRLEMK